MQTNKKPIVIRIYQGDRLVGVKQFLGGQILIGQPGDVQIPLEGEAVSLLHASIDDRNGTYYVCDLGSMTGTYKNGAQVLEAELQSGDVLQIADYRIEFFIGPPPVSVAAQSRPAVTPKVPPPQVEPVAQPRPQPRPHPQAVAQPTMQPQQPVSQFAAKVNPAPAAATAAGGEIVRPKRHSVVGKSRKTFAPPSKYKDVRDFIKPSKGTVVEVLVAWRERVIASYHFSGTKTITVGSHPDNDIILPLASSKIRKMPILQIGRQVAIFVTHEMRGELTAGQTSTTFADLVLQKRMVSNGSASTLVLQQGEMARVEVADGISLIIRYVGESPKPLVAPILDLTASETTGVVLALALVATLFLYVYLYQPVIGLPNEELDEPMRTAMIVLAPPTPPPLPTPIPTPVPTPPPVVQATPTPPPTRIQVEDKARAARGAPQPSTNLTNKHDPGMSAAAAPNRNKTGPRQQTSVKQGGAIKTTDKEGSQMQSKSRDVSKAGVFSVFGNNGAQDQLAQSTTGSGELAGLAGTATGKAGSAVNRAGTGLGSELKDTGMGGTGKALEGIAGGVGTMGRGSGNFGYGTGGLGTHQGTKIVTGGAGEEFKGAVDREGIRRVVEMNLRAIRACYERQLRTNPDLRGKLVLTCVVGEQGRVLSAGVKSNDLGNREVATCILERLKTWRFPDPPANTEYEVSAYPFVFQN